MDPICVVNKMTESRFYLPYGGKVDKLLTVSVGSPIICRVLMALRHKNVGGDWAVPHGSQPQYDTNAYTVSGLQKGASA
jgi:hypothetical protein